MTAIVAVFVESKRPTKNETWALVLLTLGVCVTVFEGNVPGNAVGLSLAVAGMVSTTAPRADVCGTTCMSVAERRVQTMASSLWTPAYCCAEGPPLQVCCVLRP